MAATEVIARMTRGEAPEVRVAIVYYSNRGTTKALVDSFAGGVQSVGGARAQTVAVADVDQHWDDLHAADGIVFATPTYIGSVAAEFKRFVEKLSNPIWLDRLWVGKLSAGITVSSGSSGDKLNCLMQLVIFASQMGMIWVPMPILGGNYSSRGSDEDLNRMAGYLGVMAQANSDQDVPDVPPRSDRRSAEVHGEYFGRTAQQVKIGREIKPMPGPPPWARELTSPRPGEG